MQLEVELEGADDVAVMFVAHLSAIAQPDCTATAVFVPELGRETLVRVRRVRVRDPAQEREWSAPTFFVHSRCLINGGRAPSPVDLQVTERELAQRRERRFNAAIGSNDPGATAFCVVCVIEGLLMQQPLRLPAIEIIPTTAADPKTSQVDLLNFVLAEIQSSVTVDPSWWAAQSRQRSPWTLLRMPKVWAPGPEAARAVALPTRDRVLHLLALNRGSSGRPIATVVGEAARGKGAVFYESGGYTGNLAGGFIAGESQHDLLVQDAAVQADRLLALATWLYREALAEADPDFAFFRFWSVLETLATNRIQPGRVVVLEDGSIWPTKSKTTDFAAPRVYELLRLKAAPAAPAASLYEAVRAWYGRRNATAHYGRFDPTDPLQKKQPWFPFAQLTEHPPPVGGIGDWLRGARDAAHHVLRREQTRVGQQVLAST